MNVLIIGGSNGIGAALVRLLSKTPYKIIPTYYRNKEKALLLEKETGCKFIQYDFNSEKSITALLQTIRDGSFDALVNNASAPIIRNSILELSTDEILNYLHKGLSGILSISKEFSLSVKQRRSKGTIINVLSSVVLGMPPAKQLPYVMLKHCLLGLSKAQAAELSKYNIRVNSVSPSMTKTDFISDLPLRFIESQELSMPMKRIANAEEVASVIKFLLSQESNYINGSNIPVTGGQTC